MFMLFEIILYVYYLHVLYVAASKLVIYAQNGF